MMDFGHVMLRYVGGLVILSVLFITLPLLTTSQDEIVLQHEYTNDGSATLYLLDGKTGIRTAFDQIDSQIGSEAGWSPDGQFIHILEQQDNEIRQLRVFDSTTGHFHTLTETLYPLICMVPLWWSPNGHSLAFMEGKYNQTNTINLWDVTHRSIITLGQIQLSNSDEYIAWSPDSRYGIVFNVGDSPDLATYSLLIYDTMNGQVIEHSVTGSVAKFYWSPDGRFLALSAYSGSYNIYLYDTRLQTLTDVIPDTKDENFLGWLPSVNKFLLKNHPQSGVENLLLVTVEQGESQVIVGQSHNIELENWSPNGRYIALNFKKDNVFQVMIWDMDNWRPVYIRQFQDTLFWVQVMWSADSRYAFVYPSTEQPNNFEIVDILDGKVEEVENSRNRSSAVSWSPTDHYLAMLLNPDNPENEAYTLVLINPSDGSIKQVADNVPELTYYGPQIEWSSDGRLLSFTNDRGWLVYDVYADYIHELGVGHNLRWLEGTPYLRFDRRYGEQVELYSFDSSNGLLKRADSGVEQVYLAYGVRRSEAGGLGLNYCGEG